MALVILLFVLGGVANGSLTPFTSAILVERGISATWVGVIGAAVSLLFVGLASAWGHLADVVLGRGRAFALAFALAAGLIAVFALPLPPLGIGLAYTGFATAYGLLFPLQDALAVNTLPDPGRQYGTVRGLQSGAYALAAVVAGAVWAGTGYGPAVPVFIALAIPTILVALRVPDVARARLDSPGRGGAIREALRVSPVLPRVLLGIGLANIGVFAALTFLPLLVLRLGGSSGQIGLVMAVTAGIEVVAMPAASRLLARFGPRAVLAVSLALIAVVFAGWALATAPEHVIVAAVLYGFAWAGMWVASVTTVRRLLPPTLQGSGQALLSITTAGIAAFIGNVGGGLLWTGPGPLVVFAIAAVFAAVGSLVAWWSAPGDGHAAMAVA